MLFRRKVLPEIKYSLSLKEQSPTEKQNKYSHNPSKSQNQIPKNARIKNENLRFFVVVYSLFYTRDGMWGSAGIWAEKGLICKNVCFWNVVLTPKTLQKVIDFLI